MNFKLTKSLLKALAASETVAFAAEFVLDAGNGIRYAYVENDGYQELSTYQILHRTDKVYELGLCCVRKLSGRYALSVFLWHGHNDHSPAHIARQVRAAFDFPAQLQFLISDEEMIGPLITWTTADHNFEYYMGVLNIMPIKKKEA